MFLSVIASIAILAVAIAFVVLVRSALQVLKKVGRTVDDLSELTSTLNREVVPITQNAASTLEDANKLIREVNQTVELVNRVAGGADRLIETARMATAASQAVKTSTAGLISVYEGVKQGIKTLRGS